MCSTLRWLAPEICLTVALASSPSEPTVSGFANSSVITRYSCSPRPAQIPQPAQPPRARARALARVCSAPSPSY